MADKTTESFILKSRMIAMKELLLTLYNFLTVLLPSLVIFILLNRKSRKKNCNMGRWHPLLVFIFTFYVFCVFLVTGAGTIFELLRCNIAVKIGGINFIPFSGFDTVSYGLNILMLVPLGFLLPFIWPATAKLICTVLYGFSFSVLIEVSQLFTTARTTDIDDVLMNTLGALIGYLLFRLLVKRKGQKKQESNSHWEPALYIAAMFVGHFFLFNELWMAGRLYGF